MDGRVNAWYNRLIFWSQWFFSIPYCIARLIVNTLDISSTYKSLEIDFQLERSVKYFLFLSLYLLLIS
jgi:hypothetical protein